LILFFTVAMSIVYVISAATSVVEVRHPCAW
jgi:hypothetical protein